MYVIQSHYNSIKENDILPYCGYLLCNFYVSILSCQISPMKRKINNEFIQCKNEFLFILVIEILHTE
jgi:hypothetical protein